MSSTAGLPGPRTALILFKPASCLFKQDQEHKIPTTSCTQEPRFETCDGMMERVSVLDGSPDDRGDDDDDVFSVQCRCVSRKECLCEILQRFLQVSVCLLLISCV